MDRAFDIQQRLHLLRRFLEHLVSPATHDSPSWALHVGAGHGEFVTESSDARRVVTLDRRVAVWVPRVGEALSSVLDSPDHIRAASTALPFESGIFEAVAAGDVLEHLTDDGRWHFLSEAARVSRGWVLINGPFRSPNVEQAEQSISALHQLVTGLPDEQLDEHWQCGLPELSETRARLAEMGFVTAVVPNGSLFNWFFVKSLDILFRGLPEAIDHFDQISELYIRLWSATDHRRPTYRHLVLAHRDADQVYELIQNPPSKAGLEFFGPETNVPNGNGDEMQRIRATATLVERIISMLCARAADPDGAVERLRQLVAVQERQRGHMEREIGELRERLKSYESSRLVRLWSRLRGT